MPTPKEQIPEWFSDEERSLVERQGLSVDEAFEIVERLAIQENS